jgi:tRNA(Ser,Leu) C12 N-acetylase TAN1
MVQTAAHKVQPRGAHWPVLAYTLAVSKMKDWNVIVTVNDSCGYRHARQRLRQFGTVEATEFHNVLVMQVPDVGALPAVLGEMMRDDMSLFNDISRLIPAHVAFDFETREEFETKAMSAILGWAERMAGEAFHIRFHRRGLGGQLRSLSEEKLLDTAVLDRLAEIGRPGRIDFADPDHVIDIETVGNRAGLSIWGREDLQRYPFLRVD